MPAQRCESRSTFADCRQVLADVSFPSRRAELIGANERPKPRYDGQRRRRLHLCRVMLRLRVTYCEWVRWAANRPLGGGGGNAEGFGLLDGWMNGSRPGHSDVSQRTQCEYCTFDSERYANVFLDLRVTERYFYGSTRYHHQSLIPEHTAELAPKVLPNQQQHQRKNRIPRTMEPEALLRRSKNKATKQETEGIYIIFMHNNT
jgi:hypothetical protein